MPKPFPILAASVLSAAPVFASPVTSPWPVDGPDDTSGIAAAGCSGWYAAADSYEDSVELRDIRGTLITTVTRAQIQAALPWMTLDGGQDGPGALALTDSGRTLYIAVHDDAPATDGGASDAILACDVETGAVTVAIRIEVSSDAGDWADTALAHFGGRLYLGTAAAGVRVYATPVSGPPTFIGAAPAPGPVRGLAIDRDRRVLFVATDTTLLRGPIPAAGAPTLTTIGALGTGIRAIAFSDHYGGAVNTGLYSLSAAAGSNSGVILHAPTAEADGTLPLTPGVYATVPSRALDLAATADGALLVATDEDAIRITDTADTRLGFEAWIRDEFAQVVEFGRRLVSPDGEPAGWVIDADVPTTWTRFHPATPDAAAWTVLLQLTSDHVRESSGGDPLALPAARTVLKRYAGLMPDGVRPSRTQDGIFRHWIDPRNGGAKPGWSTEFATLSTMKIVAAADRAVQAYPDDPEIALAASRIVHRTRNWAAYTRSSPAGVYFVADAATGPQGGAASAFNEGIIFIEQAAAYGSGAAATSFTQWLNRSAHPSAAIIPGRTVAGDVGGNFQSAFTSLYPHLLSEPYRADARWRAQVDNLRLSHAAWTDLFGPRFYTVFSAGATKGEWAPGGYNADSITNHPGDVTTFTSLLALAAAAGGGGGRTPEAVGGYHAYRKGARQTFRTGTSFLYRRSDLDRGYFPPTPGLPDVALGALGLADLIRPGTVDAVLARPYLTEERCPVDRTGDGAIDEEDLYRQLAAPIDLNGDGLAGAADATCLKNWLRRHEAARSSGR